MEVNKIYNEDCLVGLKKIPDNSIDLVLIDPPYDICTAGGKKGNDKLSHDIMKLEKELIDNKKLITDILTLFSRFNLVDIKGKIGDADCMIRLYPSLAFALNVEEFSRFAEAARKRMLEKGRGDEPDALETSYREDEEDEED